MVWALACVIAGAIAGLGSVEARAGSVDVSLADVEATAGTVVEVPVVLQAELLPAGETINVAGFELDLRWDPGALALESFETDAILDGWIVASSVERHAGRLAFASAVGFELEERATPVVRLYFRTHPEPRVTTIEVVPAPVYSASLESQRVTTDDGVVRTTDEVSGAVVSFGDLKVRGARDARD